MTTHGAPTNEENSSRVYVHSWLSATHTSSNKARLFIKRTNSILPLLVNEVIFESDFGDPVVRNVSKPKKASEAKVVTDTVYVSKIQHCSQKDVTSSGNKPSRKEVLDAKRARLRQLFKSDAIDLDNSFRELGYAFIPTQP
ncbi:PREDICTED: uncharacterized protein LOC108746007 isoform X1 [Trachymyrmex septentrionalis]|uniref:uncharacterized protein LOC108746007 isoform X1 n=1 Tax=Trachymyrmex septentrionalis TaxID=34720 RepID=UPI00084F8194|nr:PREDICTED: uncharacterized protein LOC108746007 isoform X1 [Trachymyrmex septentrionalis]